MTETSRALRRWRAKTDLYIVKIDQLPEKRIAARDVRTPWGRSLTLGEVRRGDIASEGDEGPQRPASPSA